MLDKQRDQQRVRKGVSRGVATGSILALVAAVIFSTILIGMTADNPGPALKSFFITPWTSLYFLGNMLDRSGLLIVTGLGIALAFKGGTFNLGGEGQVYAGGLAAVFMLLHTPESLPPPLTILAALIAALLTGGILGAVSGILKARFGVDELISSFLISSTVAPVADYLISGPLRDPASNLLATARIPSRLLLPRLLEPSSLNISLIGAVLLALYFAFFLASTATGYRIRVAGSNPLFARFAGFSPSRYWMPVMGTSGALHGLAGFFAVAGTYGLCHRGFSGGIGWNGIAVALIARNNPLALIPSALVFAWLETGASSAILSSGLSMETGTFIQAIVFLLVTARLVPLGRKYLPVWLGGRK